MERRTHTEYDIATTDHGKAFAALAMARRKQNVETAWDWARIAARHSRTLGIQSASTLLGTGVWPDLDTLEHMVAEKRADEIVIVTRHAGFVEWLHRGIVGRLVIEPQ